jgi:hypothetical protein
MNIYVNIIVQMKYSTLLHLRFVFGDLIQDIHEKKNFCKTVIFVSTY